MIEDSAWVAVSGKVYDVTSFLEDVSLSPSSSLVVPVESDAHHDLASCCLYLTDDCGRFSWIHSTQHPGGKKILLKNCGKDATEAFETYHGEHVLDKHGKELEIGQFKDSAKL